MKSIRAEKGGRDTFKIYEQTWPLPTGYFGLSIVGEGILEKSRGDCSVDMWSHQRKRKAKLFMLYISSPKATLQDSKLKIKNI